MEQKKTVLQVTEKEEKLIRMIRELRFGEVHIYVCHYNVTCIATQS